MKNLTSKPISGAVLLCLNGAVCSLLLAGCHTDTGASGTGDGAAMTSPAGGSGATTNAAETNSPSATNTGTSQ